MFTKSLALLALAATGALASGSTECTKTAWQTSTAYYPGTTTTTHVDGSKCRLEGLRRCVDGLTSFPSHDEPPARGRDADPIGDTDLLAAGLGGARFALQVGSVDCKEG